MVSLEAIKVVKALEVYSPLSHKGFCGSRMLSLYKSIKIFLNCEKIRSTFHKIDPSETSKIINERDIIYRISFGRYRIRSLHIRMHKIKRSKRRRKNFIKR